eukprot:276912_1
MYCSENHVLNLNLELYSRQAFRIRNRSATPPFYPQNRFQSSGSWLRFVKWTTQTRAPPKWSTEWWKEGAVIFTVFGVTGSSSLYLVRPLMPKLGLEGSFKEGPWSYRIGSLLLVSPCYTLILLSIGSLAGRHAFFAKQAQKMWGRFLPSSLSQKLVCPPGKAKTTNFKAPSKSGGSSASNS